MIKLAIGTILLFAFLFFGVRKLRLSLSWLILAIYIPFFASTMIIENVELKLFIVRLGVISLYILSLWTLYDSRSKIFESCCGVTILFYSFLLIKGMISDYPIIAMEMQIQGIATLIAGMGCFLTVNNINEAFRGVRLPLWGILFSVIGLLSILFSNIYTLRFSPNDVNPNAIGIFLAPCIALSLYVALWNSQKLYRFVALFLVFSLYLLIIATGSRNAAGTAMILSLILLTPLLRRPLIFFVTGLVLIGGLNLLLTNINLEGFSRLTDLDTIDHARMIFWKQRINNISNPFLGAGTAFSYNHAGELSWSNMHSIYVQIFYETGIIGLFLFAVSILFSLKKWFSLFGNVKHSMVWFAAALLATPLCIGLFESAPLFRLQMSTFFWGMGVALIDQLNRDEFYFGSHRT